MTYPANAAISKAPAPALESGWLRDAGKKTAITALIAATALLDRLPKRAAAPAAEEIVIWPEVPEMESAVWDDTLLPRPETDVLTARATAGQILLAAAILASMVLMLSLMFDIGTETPVSAAGLVSCL